MAVIWVRNPFRRKYRFDPAKSVGQRVQENITKRADNHTPHTNTTTSNARIIGKDQSHDR
jgi:uncharacterized protein with gpF-like domain